MSKLLIEGLVRKLLDLTPAEKESVGNRITKALGGDPSKFATNLSPRRGNADGGLDGRVPVYRMVVKIEAMQTENGIEDVIRREEPIQTEVEAGITIKLENKKFTRERLGGFKMDLEREGLRDGVIVSALGLTPDAVSELERLNKKTGFRLIAPTLGDFLSQRIPNNHIKFVCDPNEAIRKILETL
jgi:hypothetical protein